MSGNLRQSKSPSQNHPHVCIMKSDLHGGRRSSMDTCFTDASSTLTIVEKNTKARHSMPAPPSTPLTSHLSSSGSNCEYPAQELPRPSSTIIDDFTNISFISLDPPITQALLSELDIPRVAEDLPLRHHLNFDPKPEFRINTQGPRAEERRERALVYWRALAAEIASWLKHCRKTAPCPSSLPSCGSSTRPRARGFPPGAGARLPRLFEAMGEILKHALPPAVWPVIDARLDVSLLMQQLEHRVCSFTALSDWLGNFLRRFCSRRRYCQLHTMTSSIRSGVENADSDSIVRGLSTIFEILQGMSLVS